MNYAERIFKNNERRLVMKRATLFQVITLAAFFLGFHVMMFAQGNYIATQDGYMRMDNDVGIPRVITGMKNSEFTGTSLEIAVQYLDANSDLLYLSEDADFELLKVLENPSGTHIGFQQVINEVPVIGSETVVSLNKKNQITMVANGYKPNISISTTPTITSDEAILTARSTFENPDFDVVIPIKSKLAIFVDENNIAYLVWKLNILPKSGGDWYILVDAHSRIIRKKENIEINETGDGRVFDPDPATYFEDITLPDNNDEDYPELYDSYKFRDLEGLNPPVGGQYYLRGEYAYSEDIYLPYDPVSFESTSVFHYNRSQNGFEETNCYYHLDKTIRYVRELGFNPLWNNQTGDNTEDIVFDARGTTARNAYYSSSGEYIRYGVPANYVDAGEDQSVIIHELGHALHDALIIGGLNYYGDCAGISEGISDYFGIDYRRQLSYFLPNDRCNWFWPGLEPTIKIPEDANFEEHWGTSPYEKMQVWASSLMDLEYIEATDPSQGYRLGQDVVSTLQLASLSYVTSDNNRFDNVYAMYQSDIDIYDGAHLIDLIEVYSDRQLFDDQIINEDVIYTSNTSWDGYKLVRANVTVQDGATLTIEPGTYVFLDGAELLVYNGSTLITGAKMLLDNNSALTVLDNITLSEGSLIEVANGSDFQLIGGASLLGTDHSTWVDRNTGEKYDTWEEMHNAVPNHNGNIVQIPGDRVLVRDGGTFGTQGYYDNHVIISAVGDNGWDGIEIKNSCNYNIIEACDIDKISGIQLENTALIFGHSSFSDCGQIIARNDGYLEIYLSSFNNNNACPVITFDSQTYIDDSDFINNNGIGIAIYYGIGSLQSIDTNIISGNDWGILCYDSPMLVFYNQIVDNYSHGFVSYGGTGAAILAGNTIADNDCIEYVAAHPDLTSGVSWGPNTIYSHDNGGLDHYLLACGYTGEPIDCRGNNIDISDTTRFLPFYSSYIFDGEKPPEKILYEEGVVQITDGEYESAKLKMTDIVDNYPETETAVSALQWLMYLEKFSGHDYAGLRDYIENIDEVSYPHLERVKYNTTTSTYMAEADYLTAINRLESILTNPPSLEDSIFALIDEGYCYLKLDEQGGKAAVEECTFKPRCFEEFKYVSQNMTRDLLDKAIPHPEPSIPEVKTFALYQNYPNPMRPDKIGTTTISFSIPKDAKNSEMKIYNIKGQLVKKFSIANNQSAIEWDGKDSNGNKLSNGIYLYKLDCGGKSITKKIVLLR